MMAYFKGPSIIESIDILNFLMMTIALTAIYTGEFRSLILIMIIGLLNKETPLILLPVMFIYEWLQHKRLNHFFWILLISAITFLIPRVFISSWDGSKWLDLEELSNNLSFFSGAQSSEIIMGTIRFGILIIPFVVIGLYKFNEHPLFLKIAASVIPLLIMIHYVVGKVEQWRLWMPLFPLLIPLAVNNLVKLTGGNKRELEPSN